MSHRLLRELISIAIIVTVLFAIRSSIIDWYEIPTGSMKPTIIEGDRVFVNKLAFEIRIPFTLISIAHWDTPKRGDIVVFDSPEKDERLIKRVVGIPGDVIEIKDNVLYINNTPAFYRLYNQSLVDKYWNDDKPKPTLYVETFDGRPHSIAALSPHTPASNYGPLLVEPNHYFMLGDNRDNSADSRYIGTIDGKYILGRAYAVFYSTKSLSRAFTRLDRLVW